MVKDFQMHERREHTRYSIPLTAAVEVATDDESHIEQARVINISPGGAYLQVDRAFEIGTCVDLHILDFDAGLKKGLGLEDTATEPLRVGIQGEVLRSDKSPSEANSLNVAVMFTGPLRISSSPISNNDGSRT